MKQHKGLKGLLGVVLCGGRGTRMGGQDKGLVPFHGQPLAAYGVAALAHCQQTIINANRNHDVYQKTFQLPVVSDANDDFDGPLAGLLAALRYAKDHGFSHVISVPCDAPFITKNYVKAMWQAIQANESPQGSPWTPRSTCPLVLMANDGFRQPVFALLSVALTDTLADFLQGDHKKIIKFYQQVGFEQVAFSDSSWFANANCVETLQQYTCKPLRNGT